MLRGVSFNRHQTQVTAMNDPITPPPQGYQSLYEDFDSPLMSRLRREAYGEDIGQHSWVTADDLRRDVSRLGLTKSARLLDLGCGPCGPLTFIMKAAGCHGFGLDLSAAALAAGRRRAASLAVEGRLEVREVDLDAELSLTPAAFDAAISFDVILHVRNRLGVFSQVARALRQGGYFLFTDAGVVTGSISSEDTAIRSMHGFTQFCAPGFNERMLDRAGLTLLQTEDRTEGILQNASGRLEARMRHQVQFEQLEGAAGFARYQDYLRGIISMAERGALSRWMYLAEARTS
jgi:SAM-dependent methyltransferase